MTLTQQINQMAINDELEIGSLVINHSDDNYYHVASKVSWIDDTFDTPRQVIDFLNGMSTDKDVEQFTNDVKNLRVVMLGNKDQLLSLKKEIIW